MQSRNKFFLSLAWCLIFLGVLGCVGCTLEEAPPGMVLVSEGYFNMGTDEEDTAGHALSLGLDKPWFADESPQRRLYLDDFYIDKYEVTQLQYYVFCQATGHAPPPMWGGAKYPDGQDHLPVTQVSYYDASAYAQWVGKRLPTEMEWEKAARGPTDFDYPWGNQFDVNKANVSPKPGAKRGRGLQPVGSFPAGASPYGAEDMIGNVWEWVWDYYQPYPDNVYDSKHYGKKKVVVRGLSYLGVGHFPKKEYKKVVRLKSRVTYREKLNPLAKTLDVGFRCAKDKPTFYQKMFGSPS